VREWFVDWLPINRDSLLLTDSPIAASIRQELHDNKADGELSFGDDAIKEMAGEQKWFCAVLVGVCILNNSNNYNSGYYELCVHFVPGLLYTHTHTHTHCNTALIVNVSLLQTAAKHASTRKADEITPEDIHAAQAEAMTAIVCVCGV
jgi:hypothetical protein